MVWSEKFCNVTTGSDATGAMGSINNLRWSLIWGNPPQCSYKSLLALSVAQRKRTPDHHALGDQTFSTMDRRVWNSLLPDIHIEPKWGDWASLWLTLCIRETTGKHSTTAYATIENDAFFYTLLITIRHTAYSDILHLRYNNRLSSFKSTPSMTNHPANSYIITDDWYRCMLTVNV